MTSFPESATPTEKPTILVVDDTPENLTVLGALLQPNYRVRIATSGARALSAVQIDPIPNLILLDVMMPEMDGYAVLTQLRADPLTADIPVIFVTAMDATEDETHGLELGAADYITKPLRPAIVLARVHAQLELKQARDRMRDQNAWLETEVARRMQENQMIQDVSIRALASLAETRDHETGNHIRRTQAYVKILCEQLATTGKHPQLESHDWMERVIKAAPLHDIGKVGIPDHILLKAGKLNESEWETMRTHTSLGAEALQRVIDEQEDQAPLEFLRVAIDIAHFHHEKWDGSGYPEGRQGDDIPLPARLMALADVFDALINRRVYKTAFSFEESEAFIVNGRGKHFDPDVVDAFLVRIEDFRYIAQRYADAPLP